MQSTATASSQSPTKKSPPRKRRVTLTSTQKAERLGLIQALIAGGKNNTEIRRECKEAFGAQVNDQVIASMRTGPAPSNGHAPASGKTAPAAAKSKGKIAVKAGGAQTKAGIPAPLTTSERDAKALQRTFVAAMAAMRRSGIEQASLDTASGKASYTYPATQTLNLQ